ncbi:hypothetical protein JJB11_01735 [Ramlibacter ginsenosidimutans]|uniref:Exonuclease domain-containing protein n=1 Tax=Ramlibacter ginsenosidimutans TaxID=502333 RepID=A0A934TP55_9BURK|nr:hypothetical protein [Ramlibacter ginsenosidimutans]MBK6004798.1 hypothetical protein [Ramlibacter ginsenosidimutans]
MIVPSVLDIEASGFGRGSYPVEVGYVLDDGNSQCMLVHPAPDWDHWSPAAERLHRITRADLLEHGLPIVVVAQELNHHLCGRTLYTDAWGHDYSWLARLYDAARRAPTFRLESLHSLLTESERARWSALKAQVATALGLPRHRACADARLLQATFGELRARRHGDCDRTRCRPAQAGL